MVKEDAVDIIGDAISALHGVQDLLIFSWQPGQDLHTVDPENLERLLDLIARELRRGRDMLDAAHA